MRFASDVLLTWSPPQDPGASALRYDTLRTPQASDFLGAASCVETGGLDTQTTDGTGLAPGTVRFYLARAENDCPGGQGSLGQASDGSPRAGRDCP
jgi:hypothetical protein